MRSHLRVCARTQLHTHVDFQSNTSASGSYIDPMGSTAISHIANLHASVDGTQNLAPHFLEGSYGGEGSGKGGGAQRHI